MNWDNIIAPDIVKFAALFGIFIYSEETHHTYNDFVNDVISRGGGVYVFADSTLNYGNSFPFNNGIITDDMATHSDKTLLQLMSRAGRPEFLIQRSFMPGNQFLLEFKMLFTMLIILILNPPIFYYVLNWLSIVMLMNN